MTGLMRLVKTDIVRLTAVAAGWTSAIQDVSKVEFIGIFVRSSAATTLHLEVETTLGFITFDSFTFPAAGGDHFWNIWSFPFERIRFRSTAAVTLTIQLFIKT